jgi:hypothetical protein
MNFIQPGAITRLTTFFAQRRVLLISTLTVLGAAVLMGAYAAGGLVAGDPTIQPSKRPVAVASSPSEQASPSPTATPTPTPAPAHTAASTPKPAPASQSCANPKYTLAKNPSNPQDGITLGGFYITNDTWNAANYQLSQTMYICDYSNWYVVANMNNNQHDGAVKTYPNVHKDFNNMPKVSSFATITSSFAESGPHVGIYQYAYDIWLNGVGDGANEVMIWNDNFGQTPAGSKVATVSFDGRTYNVFKTSDNGYIALVDTANTTAGTINIKAMIDYLVSKGWLPASSTLGQIDYGAELVSTNGANATFRVTNFSLTAR